MDEGSLKVRIENLSVAAGDGFLYPLTKRFFYLYAYLAFQRVGESGVKGGFAGPEQIRHLPFWEKNSFVSIGKQNRRHIVEMERLGRNVLVPVQRIKGPFGLKIDPADITFDALLALWSLWAS